MPNLKIDQVVTHIPAATTGATGMALMLGMVPDVLGCIAAVVGISVTILYYRFRKKKHKLEITLLMLEIENEKNHNAKI